MLLVTETWLHDDQPVHTLPDFSCVSVPRPVQTFNSGHAHGGVAAYIRNSVHTQNFRVWKQDAQHGYFWLHFSNFTPDKIDMYIACIYMRPQCVDCDTTFSCLQDDVATIQAQNGHILIAGDLNARTGNLSDVLCLESDHLPVHDIALETQLPRSIPTRTNADGVINSQGRSLLSFCCTTDMFILNGRVHGDLAGNATCFAYNGGTSSVDISLRPTHYGHTF